MLPMQQMFAALMQQQQVMFNMMQPAFTFTNSSSNTFSAEGNHNCLLHLMVRWRRTAATPLVAPQLAPAAAAAQYAATSHRRWRQWSQYRQSWAFLTKTATLSTVCKCMQVNVGTGREINACYKLCLLLNPTYRTRSGSMNSTTHRAERLQR